METLITEFLKQALSSAVYFAADVVDLVYWFIQTLCSQIGNREIASLLLILAILVFAACKGEGRSLLKSLGKVVACAMKPVLLMPFLFLLAYSALIVSIAFRMGIWSVGVLLDTVCEIVLIGFPAMSIAARSKTVTSIARELVLPELGFGVLASFYVGIEDFSILVEIGMQVLILFCALTKGLAENRAELKHQIPFINGILAFIGVAILTVTTFRIYADWPQIDWTEQLESLAMSVWYPVSMLPAVIAIGFYSAFSSLRFRLKVSGHRLGKLRHIVLVLELLPSLSAVAHFSAYDARQYSECGSLLMCHKFCRDYRRKNRDRVRANRLKLKRYKTGSGKRGFDKDGLWLDWENLESIKNALGLIESLQYAKWRENGVYDADYLEELVAKFTPAGCEGSSCVTRNGRVFACWMNNATGFTFGIGATNGGYPAMRYEGERPPHFERSDPLASFVPKGDYLVLPNWRERLKADERY